MEIKLFSVTINWIFHNENWLWKIKFLRFQTWCYNNTQVQKFPLRKFYFILMILYPRVRNFITHLTIVFIPLSIGQTISWWPFCNHSSVAFWTWHLYRLQWLIQASVTSDIILKLAEFKRWIIWAKDQWNRYIK